MRSIPRSSIFPGPDTGLAVARSHRPAHRQAKLDAGGCAHDADRCGQRRGGGDGRFGGSGGGRSRSRGPRNLGDPSQPEPRTGRLDGRSGLDASTLADPQLGISRGGRGGRGRDELYGLPGRAARVPPWCGGGESRGRAPGALTGGPLGEHPRRAGGHCRQRAGGSATHCPGVWATPRSHPRSMGRSAGSNPSFARRRDPSGRVPLRLAVSREDCVQPALASRLAGRAYHWRLFVPQEAYGQTDDGVPGARQRGRAGLCAYRRARLARRARLRGALHRRLVHGGAHRRHLRDRQAAPLYRVGERPRAFGCPAPARSVVRAHRVHQGGSDHGRAARSHR
jgi:hypothetical protein